MKIYFKRLHFTKNRLKKFLRRNLWEFYRIIFQPFLELYETFPTAKRITILRDIPSLYESSFGYFRAFSRPYKNAESLENFFASPAKFFNSAEPYGKGGNDIFARNHMAFDLGNWHILCLFAKLILFMILNNLFRNAVAQWKQRREYFERAWANISSRFDHRKQLYLENIFLAFKFDPKWSQNWIFLHLTIILSDSRPDFELASSAQLSPGFSKGLSAQLSFFWRSLSSAQLFSK